MWQTTAGGLRAGPAKPLDEEPTDACRGRVLRSKRGQHWEKRERERLRILKVWELVEAFAKKAKQKNFSSLNLKRPLSRPLIPPPTFHFSRAPAP